MVKLPTNLTIQPAGKAKSDSRTFPYPIKVISGYYSVQGSATTGLSDGEQARRFADSLAGTEVMFDIVCMPMHGAELWGICTKKDPMVNFYLCVIALSLFIRN